MFVPLVRYTIARAGDHWGVWDRTLLVFLQKGLSRAEAVRLARERNNQ